VCSAKEITSYPIRYNIFAANFLIRRSVCHKKYY
jgi:hypothetical protein